MNDIKFNEEYQMEGEWSFPDIEEKVHGVLILEERVIKLELVARDSVVEKIEKAQGDKVLIKGRCTNQKCVTLIDSVLINWSITHDGISSATFIANECLLGSYFSNETKVHSINVFIHNLSHWISYRYFKHDMVGRDQTVKLNIPESLFSFKTKWENNEFEVSLNHNLKQIMPVIGNTKYSAEFEPFIQLRSESGFELENVPNYCIYRKAYFFTCW